VTGPKGQRIRGNPAAPLQPETLFRRTLASSRLQALPVAHDREPQMPNGAVAQLPPELEPASKPAPSKLEIQIGTAMADAVEKVCLGVLEFQRGEIKRAAKTAGGNTIIELHRLRQLAGEPAFIAAARQQGRAALRQRLVRT
jgi:hypothetical protein